MPPGAISIRPGPASAASISRRSTSGSAKAVERERHEIAPPPPASEAHLGQRLAGGAFDGDRRFRPRRIRRCSGRRRRFRIATAAGKSRRQSSSDPSYSDDAVGITPSSSTPWSDGAVAQVGQGSRPRTLRLEAGRSDRRATPPSLPRSGTSSRNRSLKMAQLRRTVGRAELGEAELLGACPRARSPPAQPLDLPLRRAVDTASAPNTTRSAPMPLMSWPIRAAERRGSVTVVPAKIWPRSGVDVADAVLGRVSSARSYSSHRRPPGF